MTRQDRPVVLVTGSRQGIGLYLARRYVEQGCRVIGCSRGPASFSDPAYRHFRLDIADPRAVKAMFAEVGRAEGRLDALINNAAINPALSPAILVPFESARRALEVNFLGAFTACVEASKLMMRRKQGRIVSLSSMAVRHEVAGEAIYTASKAALTAFCRVFAKKVAGYGITCNVLAPAAVGTGLMKGVSPKALREILKRNAFPKPGSLSDVGAAVDWLISPESAAVTGQVIYLGGA